MNGETVDSLRVHVRRGLDRFCLGHYFMEYGLQENTKLIPDNVDTDNLDASGITEKGHPFQIFLKAVATEIVKEKGEPGKGRKKRIKEYLEVLQAFQDEWIEYIRKNMRKKLQAKVPTNISSPEPKASAFPDGKSKDGTPGMTDKKKRGKRGPYKKRKLKEPQTPEPIIPSPKKRQKIVDMEAARRDFEEEKKSIMASVPERNKRLFSQVGFAKWGKGFLPAMALDPYNVPPGDIRDQWMKMYQNVVQKNRIEHMGHLVWWINPDLDGLGSYSVVPHHGFLEYDEGAKKGMHELPKNMKRLLEKGKELNSKQAEMADSLSILNELALQSPEEREHPRSNFVEEDFWGVEGEEEPSGVRVEGLEEEEEELLDDEEDLLDSASESVKAAQVKKKKKTKKRKQHVLEEGAQAEEQVADEIIYDNIEEVAPVKKKKKKDKTALDGGRKKKKKKKSFGELDNNNLQVEGPAAPFAESDMLTGETQFAFGELAPSMEVEPFVEPQVQEPSAPQSQDLPAPQVQEPPAPQVQEPPAPQVQEPWAPQVQDSPAPQVQDSPAPQVQEPSAPQHPLTNLMVDDASGGSADSALVDSDYGGLDGEHDEKLPNIDATTSKGKKLLKKISKKKDKTKKDEMKAKKKKKKEKKEKAAKESKKRTKAAEQRDFERCEEDYLPVIEKLKSAKEKRDIGSIQKVLEKLLPVAESFTASFFSEYEIPKLMKATKTVLEEENGDTSTYRKLWNKMKASYTQKVRQLPEGFKAKKGKGLKNSKESSERATEDDPVSKSKSVKEEEGISQSTPLVRPDPAPVSESFSHAKEGAAGAKSSGGALSLPLLKVPLKEGKRRSSADSDQLSKTLDKVAPKPKPKKFSVMDFMSKKKENKRISSGTPTLPASSSDATSSKKSAPEWVTAPLPSAFDSFVGCDRREDRLFALEFLLQAAAHFPAGKGANEESVARSLEMAIYEWSESHGAGADAYWGKVHAIVAALTGKREVGTLVNLIMEGCFSSAKSIVELPVETLEKSFEGRPLDE